MLKAEKQYMLKERSGNTLTTQKFINIIVGKVDRKICYNIRKIYNR